MRPPARTTARRPRPSALTRAACALGALAALAGTGNARAAQLAVSLQGADGHALPGAVITARPLDGQTRKAAPLHAVVDQVDRTFVPDLLVIPVGSTVEFPNSDAVSHQIYSFSSAKHFQLPLYRGKPYPPVHFDQSGVITLGCNIHDEMLAYLLVTDAPYFGRTDSTGRWSTDLPRGRYQVTVWHPRIRDSEADLVRELTIGEGDRAELTLHLLKPLQPAPLADHPHSWDY
jgi:plastocyanin